MKHKYLYYKTAFILVLLSGLSCNKFVSVEAPGNVLVTSSVFASDATASSAITGIYIQMMQSTGQNIFPAGSPTVLFGLSADELHYIDPTSPEYNEFESNNLTITNTEVDNFWNQAYSDIYLSNAAIEGLASSTAVSDPLKKQLTGEAKFIRAFCHFYLVNTFGNIPLITSSDYRANKSAARASVASVYQQIESDLQDAVNLLSADYSYSNGNRTRPNKWCAIALLSRIHLYMGEWQKAEMESSSIISQSEIFSLTSDLDSIFLKDSPESIWQLMPIVSYFDYAVQDAFFFLPYPGTSPFATVSSSLMQSFEPADKRKEHWIDSTSFQGQSYYVPFKYKQKFDLNTTEYYTVFRLAEQYLIRAEARAQQGELPGALDDLNTIRRRSGLSDLDASLTKSQILDTLAHERRIELLCEWGHRWFDLKRTNTADATLQSIKSGWRSTDTLYPIPEKEIQNDPFLDQNNGY